TNCEINIDDCASKPCINGLCSDLVNDYSCSCFTGWEGRNCNFNHNDCPTGVCLNGGRCIDGNGTFTCDCTDTGFTGDRCQSNIDDCASKPCANGLCTDLVKNYSCSCFTGWEGRSCSVDTDYCLSGPCQNGGVCSDGNSTFTCDCSHIDFQGDTCSSKIDDCASSPCQHGGRCTDGVRSFTCDCLPGYEGSTCSVDINECERFGQPCQNGAVCKDLVADYACTGCPAKFGGKNCSVLLPLYSFGISGLVSSASFASLPNASTVSGGDSWTIELRLVTLSRGAFLLLLGDPSDSATTPRLLVTIDHDGHLSAQLLHSNGSHIAALTSPVSVTTGSFVSVKIYVSISGRSLSLSVSSSVSSASLSSASPLPQLSGQLIIGGFSGAKPAPAPSFNPSRRSRRSMAALPTDIARLLSSNISAFRGVIGATKINSDRALIFEQNDSSWTDRLPAAIVASESVGILVFLKLRRAHDEKHRSPWVWDRFDLNGPTGVRVGHLRPDGMPPCPQEVFF
uniref:EGF-like domain-containing protein n=1 Tax=Macrostomum lignano TaxID=282301 RepID=A0A1I8FWN0_9PLAT